jgi:DNA-binding response OmpR family regulator
MKKRVVVIDDDELILAVASEYLISAGFEVDTTVCSLNSNSLIYKNPPPALILVDVMMPLMNGDKKLKLLKGSRSTRDIPILLMSAKSEAELKGLAEDCGADGYLTKPFSSASLLGAVKRFTQH